MKLTVNEFFWYSSPVNEAELNADRCGNQMRSKGWINILNARYSLRITTMPKESFSGVIVDTHNDNKEIHLNAYTLPAIIRAANEFIGN